MTPTISITVAPRLVGKTTLTRKGATKGEQNAWKWFLSRQAPGGKPEVVEAGNRSAAQRKLKVMIADLLSAGFPVEVEMKDQAHTGFRTSYSIKAGKVEMGPVETIRSTTGIVGPRCHPFPYTKEDQQARAKHLRYVPSAAKPAVAAKPTAAAKPAGKPAVKPAAKPAAKVASKPPVVAKPATKPPGKPAKPAKPARVAAPKPAPAATRRTSPGSVRPDVRATVRPAARVATPVPAPAPRAATPRTSVPAPRTATPAPRAPSPAPAPRIPSLAPAPRVPSPAPAPYVPSNRPLPGSRPPVGTFASPAAPVAPTMDASDLLRQLQASVSAAIEAA